MKLREDLDRPLLKTPRGYFQLYDKSWEEFQEDPTRDDWGFWFDHYTPEDADWNHTEKWYKIMHNARDNSVLAVLYRDFSNGVRHEALKPIKEDFDIAAPDTAAFQSMVEATIKQVWDIIGTYRALGATLESIGKGDYENIVSDLLTDGYTAIGQLQKLLDSEAPGTQEVIDQGAQEAEQNMRGSAF